MDNLKTLLGKLPGLNRWRFRSILSNVNGLDLDYAANQEGVPILKSIFIDREYADYFPFYEPATIIDVGGYLGYFTLFAARHTAPGARIWALEPSSANFRILKQNLAKNKVNNVVAIQKGLAAQTGTTRLSLHSHSYNHSIIFSSADYENISLITLAQLLAERNIDRVDFLKLDCEGAEYDILFQMDKLTLSKVQTISLEFHDTSAIGKFSPNQLAAWLEENGFRVVKFTYSRAYKDLNFGKIIATKLFTN